MPLSHVLMGLGELSLSVLAETRLGPVGLVLLFLIGVWARARRDGLAVGAAMMLTVLMLQA
ncbi:hypothetical protein ACFVZC_23485 [Streptomyces marokkonensis]|uniref:Uncharacterized protein n=1 Tax=Streptomyces marokkonensis TaxID=324855 RepID=A0ABW6QAT4_9ACTN|nr:hypothetical protein [Streptomyces marokkonensis]